MFPSYAKTLRAFDERSILRRLVILCVAMTLEGLRGFANIGLERSSIARWLVAFTFIFAILSYPRLRQRIEYHSYQSDLPAIPLSLIFLHFCMLALLWILSHNPLGAQSLLSPGLVSGVWFALVIAAVVFAALATIPAGIWLDILRHSGAVWAYALAVSFAVWYATRQLYIVWDRSGWNFAIDTTFWMVTRLLSLVLPAVSSDAARHVVGSDRFSVTIAGACSGWEGLALTGIFSSAWLWFYRRVYRFPQALLVAPAAMMLIFGLNAVRIAALILIGHFGAPGLALTGFHSQAGWIAFNIVVLGIAAVSPRIRWLTHGTKPIETGAVSNPTIPYLLPFALILAAGMIARAASDGFEWLYPLRFVCAAAAIWYCRDRYRNMQWKPGWVSLPVGAAVFLIWIYLDRGASSDNGIARGLAAMSPAGRGSWLLCRCLAATVTVPIAEELAFRGFLMRRLISVDFESVHYRRYTIPALLVSSVLFGLMHGDRWIAGTIAGLLYAGVTCYRGRLGDAVAAHATTNALLAAWVLLKGDWIYW